MNKENTKMRVCLMLALIFIFLLLKTAEAAPYVPQNIYEWVQSSARANYFFNKRAMCYKASKDGLLDLQVLLVPTLLTYDEVAIADVVAKRRWNGESLAGYDDLAGKAEYLCIDLANASFVVERVDDLDGYLTILSSTYPKGATVIEDLPEKSFERKFIAAILAYEKSHRLEIAAQSKRSLTAADLQQLDDPWPLDATMLQDNESSFREYKKDHVAQVD